MYARHLPGLLKQSNVNDCRMPSIALKVIFPGEPSRVAPPRVGKEGQRQSWPSKVDITKLFLMLSYLGFL